jgi:PAS domain-containing protein
MKFLDIFKSQIPSILKRLQDIQHEVNVTHANIKKLAEIEEALGRQEIGSGKIERALDGLKVALWLKNINGCFLFVNKTCCETILKCSQIEALNLKNGDLEKDALAQVCIKSDLKVLKSGQTQRWIEHAIYEDGRHVFIDTIKSPVYDDNAKVIGIVGSAVNITDSVPDVIKTQHVNAGSIEIPLNLTMDGQQFADILERRETPRVAGMSMGGT